MSRVLRTVLVLAFALSACAKKQTAPQAATLDSGRISDDSGEMQVELAYVPKGDSIDFVVGLRAVGTDEMDKIVVEVTVDGFDVIDGESQWAGFVPPMTKHTQRVSLRVAAGEEFASVTVTVSRSVDSHVLMQTEMPFMVSGGKVVPDA